VADVVCADALWMPLYAVKSWVLIALKYLLTTVATAGSAELAEAAGETSTPPVEVVGLVVADDDGDPVADAVADELAEAAGVVAADDVCLAGAGMVG
jgi:hypothetical protein